MEVVDRVNSGFTRNNLTLGSKHVQEMQTQTRIAFSLLYYKAKRYYQDKDMRKITAIIIPILICFFIGLTASYFQNDAIKTWYPLLNKPELTPPNLVFPIAWSIIYLCIGLSLGMIYISDSKKKRELTKLFGIQLFFNFTWSILFFYFQSPLLGFIDILILDICVTIYAIKSYPERKVSAFLFIPYIIWIYFATYLNYYILLNN